MFRRVLSLFIVILIACTTLATPRIAAACGGFFCQNLPISQTAERIIFAVDTQKRVITSVVGIAYTGEASEFSWIVPVPSVPELDVAETKSLDALADATNLVFKFPDNPCMILMSAVSGINGADDEPPATQPFLRTGSVGPFDYAIIRNERADSMLAWLRENKYRVTADMEPLIAQYVKEGQYFLAMKLQRGKAVSEIKPVVMRYTGVNPAIPIRLTAVAAVPNMQLLVWILGGARFVPQNYAAAEVDFSRMRGTMGFAQVVEGGSMYVSLNSYQAERKFIQDRYAGKAFVTEYAQPMSVLSQDTRLKTPGALDPVIAKLFADYSYVTRLRGQISPDQMTLDPIFVAKPGSVNVSNQIDLAKFVEAKAFWGCS